MGQPTFFISKSRCSKIHLDFNKSVVVYCFVFVNSWV